MAHQISVAFGDSEANNVSRQDCALARLSPTRRREGKRKETRQNRQCARRTVEVNNKLVCSLWVRRFGADLAEFTGDVITGPLLNGLDGKHAVQVIRAQLCRSPLQWNPTLASFPLDAAEAPRVSK